MPDDIKAITEKVIEWIKHINTQRKWTLTDLARKSNLSPSTLTRIFNNPDHEFAPSFKTIRKISQGSGYPVPPDIVAVYHVSTEEGDDEGVVNRYRGPRHIADADVRPVREVVEASNVRMVPVRRISSLPTGLQFADQGSLTERVPCPPQFETDRSVFAFHMPNNTLAPVLPAASLCYARNYRDPKVGDIVVLTTNDGRSLVQLVETLDEHGIKLVGEMLVSFEDLQSIAVVQMFFRQ